MPTGTVTVTFTLRTCLISGSIVIRSSRASACTTTHSIRLSLASMRIWSPCSVRMTWMARETLMASNSGAGISFVTIWLLPLITLLPCRVLAKQTLQRVQAAASITNGMVISRNFFMTLCF